MKKKLPGWAVLLIITLAAGLALGGTYALTKEPIAEQTSLAKERAKMAVLPDADSFQAMELMDGADIDWMYEGLKDGSVVGYVSQATVSGFGGKVEVTVGTDTNGVISGVRVGGADFSETAGLGAKSKEPAFYEQFTGKEYPVDLVKNGGEIDAITSATITSSAVVRGVNSAVKAMAEIAGFKINEPQVLVEELGGNRYATSKQGFGGPVYVELEIVDGVITDIVIGDASFSESPGYGAGAKEEKFYSQYIGKSGTNLTLNSDVDQVSGATITSNAVNDAVNMILLYVNDPEAFAAQMAEQPEEVDVSIPEGAAVFTAKAGGVTGTFDVTIGVDENGAVNGIELGDSDSEMDVSFLGKVKDSNAFLAQFIGAAGSVNEDAVDLVAGATVSSKAVVAAVNEALAASRGEVIETPEPAATVDVSIPEGAAVFTAKAGGITGTFDVTIGVDENGAVNGIELGDSDSEMDASFLGKVKDSNAFLAQFIGVDGPLSEENVDLVVGATVSSKAVVAAVNEAYQAQSQGETKTQPAETEAAADEPTPMPEATEAPAEEPTPVPEATEAPAEEPTPVPEATEAPAAEPTPAPEATDQKAEDTHLISVRKAEDGMVTVEAISFFTQIEAKISFVEGSVVVLSIADKPAGSDQPYAASAQERELKKLFFNAPLPLDTASQKTPYATALASAINRAYAVCGSIETAAKPIGIGEYSISQTEEGVVTVEAVSFFTQIEAKVLFVGGKVLVLSVADKAAGDQAFAPSAQEKEIKEALHNASLPLDVAGQKTPYAVALASAVNQAYKVFAGENTADEPVQIDVSSVPVVYIAATFEGDTLKTLSVKEKNAQGNIVSSDQEQALKEKFVGKQLPLEYRQDSLYESLVAIAINKAFIKEADAPAVPETQEPEALPEENEEASGEVISFFTAIQVKASFDGNVLSDLRVFDMPVGGDAYRQSAREEEMRSLFLGQEVPLSTAQQSAYASAVAAAVNQVYASQGSAIAGQDSGVSSDTGSCICFFTNYSVSANFAGNTLQSFSLFETPVGEEQLIPVEDSPLYAALTGQTMPLDAGDYSSIGVAPYAAQAVVIALNQAYEHSLSGQQ